MGWPVAALIATGVQAFSQAQAVSRSAAADAAAVAQSAAFANEELTREQQEVNRIAREEKSDRMRQAEADLARARSAAAEGFGMLHREVAELGYLEGLDLSRIESNRAAKVASLQSQKVAQSMGAANARSSAEATSRNAMTSAFIGTISSGVQIKARESQIAKEIERAKNTKPK